ncbi:hypothetical protein V490_07366 [Pseudogymnoascus sp. VKM F-3557]|nr:hypothetical protein V490_07366 [Pseudogymnoascus sp. VKM F-3557]
MEETPLLNACEWLAANPSESARVASRIFKVPKSTIRSRITRAAVPRKPAHGGYNKVLSTAQIEALKKWILEQYYLGLGANRNMVYKAVCYLRNPLPAPSQSWLSKIHMEAWYPENLHGNELILLSETGYSNSQLALRWLQHFIELTAPHDQGNPTLLLLDSHISHRSDDFLILTAEHYIILLAFPSHLTHVLQPLDVGIFQPYKHWHKQAVLRAIREVDITYNLPLFMRDLSQMRERTFKDSTIQSAFQKAGIWPISCNTALDKLRTYSQPTQPTQPTTPTLPQAITPIPTTIQGVEQGLQQWKERVPQAFSSPSRQSYRTRPTGCSAAGQELEEEAGGPGPALKLAAAEARKLSQAQNRARKLAATEARKLSQARNRARNQLKQAGIKARKQEQARKKSLAQLTELGLPIPPELEDPITDLEAEPESQYESASEGGSGRRSE